jgi:hypothetical protein
MASYACNNIDRCHKSSLPAQPETSSLAHTFNPTQPQHDTLQPARLLL